MALGCVSIFVWVGDVFLLLGFDVCVLVMTILIMVWHAFPVNRAIVGVMASLVANETDVQPRCMVRLIVTRSVRVHPKIEALGRLSNVPKPVPSPQSWRSLRALCNSRWRRLGRSGCSSQQNSVSALRFGHLFQAFAGAWSRDCNRHNSHLCPMEAATVRRVARWSLRDLALASLRFSLDGQDGS